MSLMPSGGVQTSRFVYPVPQDSRLGLCYVMGHLENRALECMAGKQMSFLESLKARESGH